MNLRGELLEGVNVLIKIDKMKAQRVCLEE